MTKLITIFDKDLNHRVFRLFYENEIEHKIDTILSISSSSSSIDVGDSVVISGVLTDENSTPLGGMSVKILRNNSVIDTVTTNSSGVYTKTVSGLNIGTYHFHAVYDGNDTYDNAISSTIDVSVVGHTYVVTITSDKQTALVGDNVTISGTLTRDGVGYGGQSVRIFDDGVLLDTVTTDNNGDYTKTISNLTLGTHRYSSQFDAVESNIVVVEVNNHLYDIDITADNPIIESGDTATITATLTDNTVPVVGETLSYTVSHDSTTIDSGTLTTGSNGSASFSYNGTGVGDVTIEIDYGTLLQKTFVIQDYWYYSTTEYKEDSYGVALDISLPSTFKVEYDITPTSRSTSGWGSSAYMRIGTDSNTGIWCGQLTSAGRHGIMPKPSGTTQYCTSNTVLNTENHITVTYDGTTVTYTCNGETVTLTGASNLTKINGVVPVRNNGLKNITVKAL